MILLCLEYFPGLLSFFLFRHLPMHTRKITNSSSFLYASIGRLYCFWHKSSKVHSKKPSLVLTFDILSKDFMARQKCSSHVLALKLFAVSDSCGSNSLQRIKRRMRHCEPKSVWWASKNYCPLGVVLTLRWIKSINSVLYLGVSVTLFDIVVSPIFFSIPFLDPCKADDRNFVWSSFEYTAPYTSSTWWKL